MQLRLYDHRGDKHAVLDLLNLNIPTYFHPSEREELIDYLDNELDYYYVVELEGQIIGACGYNYMADPSAMCISWDIVHPDHQGKGVGRMLTQHRIDEIRAIPGVHHIVVRTSQLTQGFYEKFGFELQEVKKDYWSEGFHLHHMVLDF